MCAETVQDLHKDIPIFLAQYEHKTESIVGDGNCLFRAISKLTYGSQERHEQVCTSLVEANKDTFRAYCPLEELLLEEHLLKMQRMSTWGTHRDLCCCNYPSLCVYSKK